MSVVRIFLLPDIVARLDILIFVVGFCRELIFEPVGSDSLIIRRLCKDRDRLGDLIRLDAAGQAEVEIGDNGRLIVLGKNIERSGTVRLEPAVDAMAVEYISVPLSVGVLCVDLSDIYILGIGVEILAAVRVKPAAVGTDIGDPRKTGVVSGSAPYSDTVVVLVILKERFDDRLRLYFGRGRRGYPRAAGFQLYTGFQQRRRQLDAVEGLPIRLRYPR